MMRKFMAVGAAALFGACTAGQNGDGRALRFGQVVLYADPQDFTAPISVGAKMPLGVQSNTKPALLNEYPYVESTLEVKDGAGTALTVTRTGVGRFETVFPSAGSYTMVGKTSETEDRLQVEARVLSALAFQRMSITTAIPGSTGCTTKVTGASHTLRANQQLDLSVTPVTAEGATMLGVLDLEMLDPGVTLNWPVLFPTANTYVVTPRGTGPTQITFTERTTGKSIVLDIMRDAADATCP